MNSLKNLVKKKGANTPSERISTHCVCIVAMLHVQAASFWPLWPQKKIREKGSSKKQTDGIEMQVLLFFQTFLLFLFCSGGRAELIVAKSKRLTDTQCNLRLSI